MARTKIKTRTTLSLPSTKGARRPGIRAKPATAKKKARAYIPRSSSTRRTPAHVELARRDKSLTGRSRTRHLRAAPDRSYAAFTEKHARGRTAIKLRGPLPEARVASVRVAITDKNGRILLTMGPYSSRRTANIEAKTALLALARKVGGGVRAIRSGDVPEYHRRCLRRKGMVVDKVPGDVGYVLARGTMSERRAVIGRDAVPQTVRANGSRRRRNPASFKSLPIGASFWHGSAWGAGGACVKTGPRTYSRDGVQYKVGSVNHVTYATAEERLAELRKERDAALAKLRRNGKRRVIGHLRIPHRRSVGGVAPWVDRQGGFGGSGRAAQDRMREDIATVSKRGRSRSASGERKILPRNQSKAPFGPSLSERRRVWWEGEERSLPTKWRKKNGRKAVDPASLVITRIDHGPYGAGTPGNMYSWQLHCDGAYVSGYYHGSNGYPRKGGSGLGACINDAHKIMGFNKVSDKQMADLLKGYGRAVETASEIHFTLGGGLKFIPGEAMKRNGRRRNRARR